ncbi:MAG TPA: DHHA2 domain-containing protein [Patescibacteria group bacterium]|nr:DHHA2 domain-containing protein [Patescibacteria group bacterium]
MNPVLVTCYVNPDLDGLASAVAYAEYLEKTGIDAEAAIIGEPHEEAKYVLHRFAIPRPKQILDTKTVQKIILVDSSDLNGLEGKILPEKVIEIIDHRAVNEAHKFPNASIQIELVGAAATLVAEKFMRQTIPISKPSSILLVSAIISNTLNFKGSVTTERDRKVSEWLNQTAQLPDGFWKELFTAKSDLSGSKLAERIDGDFAEFSFGNKRIGIAQLEIIGAEKLIEQRLIEIRKILQKLKQEKHLDFVFQNTIDLEKGQNYLIAADDESKDLLEKSLETKFTGNVAKPSVLLMRKQIVPRLKDTIENKLL